MRFCSVGDRSHPSPHTSPLEFCAPAFLHPPPCRQSHLCDPIISPSLSCHKAFHGSPRDKSKPGWEGRGVRRRLTYLPASTLPPATFLCSFPDALPSVPPPLLVYFLRENSYTSFKTQISSHLFCEPFSECPQVSWSCPPLLLPSFMPPGSQLSPVCPVMIRVASFLLPQAVNP